MSIYLSIYVDVYCKGKKSGVGPTVISIIGWPHLNVPKEKSSWWISWDQNKVVEMNFCVSRAMFYNLYFYFIFLFIDLCTNPHEPKCGFCNMDSEIHGIEESILEILTSEQAVKTAISIFRFGCRSDAVSTVVDMPGSHTLGFLWSCTSPKRKRYSHAKQV